MAATSQLTTGLALARIGFAVGLLVSPRRVAAGWMGEEAGRPVTQIAIRGLSGRDLALSVGLLAGARGEGRRTWLAASAAGDLADVVSTFRAGDHVSERSRWGTLAVGGGSALAATALLLAGD